MEDRMKTALKGLAVALFTVASLTAGASAQDADYPNRAITWVVPYGTATIADTSVRVIAKALSEQLGQPVIIDNRAGAGGIVGTEYVARAEPDGYTMVLATSATMAVFPSLYEELPYSPLDSFVPVNGTTSSAMLLFVNANKPYKTLDEFIEYIRDNPGAVNFGSSGNGTTQHLAGEMLQAATGADMTHVPYNDSAGMRTDLLNGTLDAAFDFPSTMGPYVETGDMIPLAVARDERLTIYPDVPTFQEMGLDVVMTSWGGVAMPAGTPPGIVERMAAAISEAASDPEVVSFYENNNTNSLSDLGPEGLRDFYGTEIEKFRALMELAGVEPR